MTPSNKMTVGGTVKEGFSSYALKDVCAMNSLTVTSGDQLTDIAIVSNRSDHSLTGMDPFSSVNRVNLTDGCFVMGRSKVDRERVGQKLAEYQLLESPASESPKPQK